MKYILLVIISLFACAACMQHNDVNEKIVTSALINSPEENLVSCLGDPKNRKEVHTKQYLNYVGKNNCHIIFILQNNKVTDVIYTSANGKRIEPEQCQLPYERCI